MPGATSSVPSGQHVATQARGGLGPVLLATDGRDSTDAAIVVAVHAAKRLGVAVQPIAVLRPIPAFRIGGELPQLPLDYERTRRAEMHREVTRRLEPVFGSAGEWQLEFRTGIPAVEITRAARELDAPLIVIGRGAHGLLDRVLGEEISLQVVRMASVPVLAVDPRAEAPIRRIVAGMDFSAASIRAAQAALRVMDAGPGGLVALVHARPRIDFGPPSVASWTRGYEERVTQMFGRLCELLARDTPEGVLLEMRLCTGTPFECLRDTALDVEADLIAVGTRSAGWLDRLFIGSVAAAALRHARESVLVAPPPSPAERIGLELSVAGGVTVTEPEDWARALDGFTRRNFGRPARLEIGGHGLDGFVVQGRRARFAGASWDAHDARVVIMLTAEEALLPHLTHGITDVESVRMLTDDAQRDTTLVIVDRHGEAVLTFQDRDSGGP